MKFTIINHTGHKEEYRKFFSLIILSGIFSLKYLFILIKYILIDSKNILVFLRSKIRIIKEIKLFMKGKIKRYNAFSGFKYLNLSEIFKIEHSKTTKFIKNMILCEILQNLNKFTEASNLVFSLI